MQDSLFIEDCSNDEQLAASQESEVAMPISIDELSAAIHGFFVPKVGGAGGGTPGSIALVLDGLGSPLSPKEFGAGGTASQQQLLAQRAA